MNKKCKNCNVTFSKPIYLSLFNWNTRKYCSKKCGRAKQVSPSGKNHWKYDGKVYKKVCSLCKKDFMKSKTRAMVLWKKQKFCSARCVATYASSFSPKGELHGQWRGGRSKLAEKIRKMREYIEWRNAVYHRDKYTCKDCGTSGTYLNANHEKPFAYLLEEYNIKTLKDARNCKELWDITNGKTLCVPCHTMTDTYGKNGSWKRYVTKIQSYSHLSI